MIVAGPLLIPPITGRILTRLTGILGSRASGVQIVMR